MTKSKKIILAVFALLVVALLVVAAVTGGSKGKVDCPDCKVSDETCTICGNRLVLMTCSDDECGAQGYACNNCTTEVAPAPCPTCAQCALVRCTSCEGETTVRGTFWALLPAVIAIGLALITKEVYSSLFLGILSGALLCSNFSFAGTLDAVVGDGLIEAVSGNAGIFIFLIELGMLVALVNRAGGSAAFGRWASTHIKTRVGACLATFLLGILIFIDDYFNCLTVGSVMRPVTDAHRISRAKLAYLIDSTAAPVCMIAPISSWAAAVSSYAEEGQGLSLFISAIPYNFYAILTLVFIIAITIVGFDYSKMAACELNFQKTGVADAVESDAEDMGVYNPRGIIADLLFPVIVLIISSVFCLLYVGGIFDGASIPDAFANTDATVGLPMGGLIALVISIIYMSIRRVLSLKDCLAALPKGFNAMVPAILILTFATALKNMTTMLGTKYFVYDLMSGSAAALASFLPAIIFLVACFLAFSTGTSWGTFGILIPIVTGIFANDHDLMIIGMSACLAGAVCGDHCSPISDTTIMSSAGAECDHLTHVSTQMPYALTVAGISFVMFIISGLVQNIWICLPLGVVLTVATAVVLKLISKKRKLPTDAE